MTSKGQQILIVFLVVICLAPSSSQGLGLLQNLLSYSTRSGQETAARSAQASDASSDPVGNVSPVTSSNTAKSTAGLTEQQQILIGQQQEQPYTIAGLSPAHIASLFNTGFSYMNIHDQCRSRSACDVGFMLYKKLNFVHNWIIRTSVNHLVGSNNVYAQSWTSGMYGKNCTQIFPACNQSPLDSLMNFALIAG